MKRLALPIALISLTGPALADPLTAALDQGGGALCFTRTYDSAWLKTHRGQSIRDVRLVFSENDNGAVLRMSLKGPGKPIYIFGVCEWWDKDLNRGVQDNIIFPTWKTKTGRGVGCHMMTDTTGVSAEEGGDFPIAWGDGRYVEAYMESGATGWHNYDTRRKASFLDLKPADSVFRVNRAPKSDCGELLTKFAPKAEI